MEVRTFRAGTLQEALQLVRHSLGPDAAVLTTRNLRVNRLGLFPKTMIEVEASVDRPTQPDSETAGEGSTANIEAQSEDATSQEALESKSPVDDGSSDDGKLDRSRLRSRTSASAHDKRRTGRTAPATERIHVGELPPLEPTLESSDEATPSNRSQTIARPGNSRLREDQFQQVASASSQRINATKLTAKPIAEVKQPLVAPAARRPNVSNGERSVGAPNSAMISVLTEMLEAGIEPTYAKALLSLTTEQMPADFVTDTWKIRQQLTRVVMGRLECSGAIKTSPGTRSVIAFVGPTGSGKTSTLAKIAAGMRFETGCQIGLITVDTFRLGAVDQLLQYAELMAAQLEVVSSADQIAGALERLAECDLVMLDTAGRSHRDTEQLSVIAELIEAASPDSVQLVISATSARAQVYDTIEKFSDVGPTELLITKLDEAVAFGEWMSVLGELSLPVSYLTTGQHVPQDIIAANPRRLASVLLGNNASEVASQALATS